LQDRISIFEFGSNVLLILGVRASQSRVERPDDLLFRD
jgi:hypothetical protein